MASNCIPTRRSMQNAIVFLSNDFVSYRLFIEPTSKNSRDLFKFFSSSNLDVKLCFCFCFCLSKIDGYFACARINHFSAPLFTLNKTHNTYKIHSKREISICMRPQLKRRHTTQQSKHFHANTH